HPIAAGLVDMRSMAFKAARPADLVDRIYTMVQSYDGQRARSLATLVEAVRAFQERDSAFTVEHLLSELALGRSGARAPGEGGGVKIATLHATKGLEWPLVYLVGLEDGSLPDYRAKSPQEISDQRRLCFVGVCRAQDRLVLSRVGRLSGWTKMPSPFLNEM